MIGKTLRLTIALLSFPTVLVATSAGAASLNGTAILVQSFAVASHKTSMTISGTLMGQGTTLTISGKYTSKGSGGITTVQGVGTSDEVQPSGAKYGYVKATTLAALGQLLEITNPKSSEINVWYKVTSKDPRFADFFGGSSTVAQTFSFSSIGWIRSATYESITTLKGVPVIMMIAASHLFADKSGYNEEQLYITDSGNPLPFAMTGPIGTTGLVYFSKWNSTTLAIPNATTALPR
jgi:hypothetical protein